MDDLICGVWGFCRRDQEIRDSKRGSWDLVEWIVLEMGIRASRFSDLREDGFFSR